MDWLTLYYPGHMFIMLSRVDSIICVIFIQFVTFKSLFLDCCDIFFKKICLFIFIVYFLLLFNSIKIILLNSIESIT
jgi:hypothetical protein